MTITVDCRGMSCPAPVITVKRALEEHPEAAFSVYLDEGAARENVTRFLKSKNLLPIESPREDGTFCLTLSASEARGEHTEQSLHPLSSAPQIMVIASDQLGSGPADLGQLLLKNFIISLLDQTHLPDRILFLNTGIHLAIDGSEVLEALLTLEKRGVELFSCGLCLDYFGKKELLRAGVVTNMFSTVESLLSAGRVISIT